MFGVCLVDAALGFVPFGAGYLIKMGSKSVRLLNVVIKGSKLARNSIDFYRNTKNFVFSVADFYIRHEGTFFTNDFKWGLADVGDIMSMAMSGTGMLQSGAGIYKSVTDLSAFLYASGIKADIKNALGRLKNGIKNTVADIKDGFQSVVHNARIGINNARMRMYRGPQYELCLADGMGMGAYWQDDTPELNFLQASSAGKGGSESVLPPNTKPDFIVTPEGTVMDTSKNYNLVGSGEQGDWFQIHNYGKPEDGFDFSHTHKPQLNTNGTNTSYQGD